MLITQALITGLITSILTSIAIFAGLAYDSRIWMSWAPKEMQVVMPPLTTQQKRKKFMLGLPIMLAMLGYPLVMVIQYESTNGAFTLGQAFLYLWIVWFTWNVWDLLIVDWLIIVTWHPPVFDLPQEVAHLWHFNSYRYHFNKSLKGCVIVTVLAAITAFFISF